MCKPFDLFYVFRFCCERHEIALYDDTRILFSEEIKGPGKLGLSRL